MKTVIHIGFRSPAAKVAVFLPAVFQFLVPHLVDYNFGMFGTGVAKSSRCTLHDVSQDMADKLLEWGRQKEDGVSRIGGMSIKNLYDVSDLRAMPATEVFLSSIVDDWSAIKNDQQAYRAEWDCVRCNRWHLQQVDDLHVKLLRGVDFQLTPHGDWIVSDRAKSLLGPKGILFRPLKNSARFWQMLTDNVCELRTDLPPIVQEKICPACGRYEVEIRSDVLEGVMGNPEYPDFSLFHTAPVTIQSSDCLNATLGKANVILGRWEPYAQQPLRAQEDKVRSRVPYSVGEVLFFAEPNFVREIVEHGLTGWAFRPVRTVQP